MTMHTATAVRKANPVKAAPHRYYCGIDIGGTFTDCVVRDETGTITVAKSLSTPDESSRGFFDALQAVADKLSITLEQLMGNMQLLLHGTTLGTNALLELKGAKTGLITTRGHGDALIMMRSVGRSAGLPIQRLHHVSRHQKPVPLVPRSRIKEVSERVDYAGDVILPLNREESCRAIQELLADGVEAIGICLLWGFVNPEHERQIKQLVQEMAPSVYVTCGHEVVAKPGEYERSAAVAINAFIGPMMSKYLGRIEQRAAALGYKKPLVIMQSSGGAASSSEVAARPLLTIGSGPAGGLAACKYLADLLEHTNVIASDVGGTSFDVGLLHEGQPVSATESTLSQYTFSVPHLDVISIGSGGGSILWIDEHSGALKVGPESAGSMPGPACYGLGGLRPTVTDADLLMGFYSQDYFLGGRMRLDKAAAEHALATVGRKIGLSAIETAAGAVTIVEFQMAELMRQMTVQRGLDPRNFVVYAYGGAAGTHAACYARELGAKTVVVPLGSAASCWSALGVQAADIMHVYERSELLIAPFDATRLNEIFAELESRGHKQLRHDSVANKDITLERYVEMKFKLQIHLLEVPVPPGRLSKTDAKHLETDFVERYERAHGTGSAFTGAGMEIGLVRVVARGKMESTDLKPYQKASRKTPVTQREAYWREFKKATTTDVYSAESLGPNEIIRGPAIVQMPETTVVVPPKVTGGFDHYGNFILHLND
jgi:N-methylhydantoinase A